jgi:short-chain fatty acids transporter
VRNDSLLSSIAQRSCAWAERWFPDSFAFALIAVAVVSVGALGVGAPPLQIARSFGTGFWSLIPFTMQMTFIIIGGYVVADSRPVTHLVGRLALMPKTGRGAIGLVALVSIVTSMLHWGLSTVLASLLARRLGARTDLRVDYRAAGAAACLGVGSVWALGLSSSAAQLQANPKSMPAELLAVTGIIPFSETVLLWQSLLLAVIIAVVSIAVAWQSAPDEAHVRTARDLGIELGSAAPESRPARRPGEWLENSPLPTLFVVALGVAWLASEIVSSGLLATVANLNTYNFGFLTAGLLLHWRPARFIASVSKSVPSVSGVLVQFPFIGSIAAILTASAGAGHESLADHLSRFFTGIASHATFAPVIGAYSALLGLFVPSGGGKWIVEAPYVMKAATTLHYHLGWTVQIYNAAEALPNLINPFWMLPMLGILGLKARDLIGFTFIQFAINLPLVLGLLWLLGMTLSYHAPVIL